MVNFGIRKKIFWVVTYHTAMSAMAHLHPLILTCALIYTINEFFEASYQNVEQINVIFLKRDKHFTRGDPQKSLGKYFTICVYCIHTKHLAKSLRGDERTFLSI